MSHQFHYLYKITCLPTSRYYIGIHSTNDMDDEYFGSGKVLQRSVKKYGKEHHRMEILETVESRILLAEREKEVVNDFLLQDELCMNLRRGGDGGWDFANKAKKGKKFTDEHRKNISEAKLKLFKENPELRKKYANRKGIPHSEETKQKMREAKKDVPPPLAKRVIYDGVEYSSITAAQRETGLSRFTIMVKNAHLLEYVAI